MCQALTEYSEANDRPAEAPWTDEEVARHAAKRAENAMRMLDAKGIKRFQLSDAGLIDVDFVIEAGKPVKVITRRNSKGKRFLPTATTMTVEEARMLWAKLVDMGYEAF
jgi:hypothetical protein